MPLYPGLISTQFRFLTMWRVRSSLVFDPYANHAVTNIMRKMDYFPCLGLGKNQQGITEIPEYPTSIPLYGLGYRIRSFEGRSKGARG